MSTAQNEQNPQNRQRKKRRNKKKKDNSGKWGCLLAFLFIGLPIVIPVGWGLWDEGVFDPDLSRDASAYALAPAETERLATLLADAHKTQGVCYGWEVDADTAAPVQIGSNLGVGVDPRKDEARCPQYVVLKANYLYLYKEWFSVTMSFDVKLPDHLDSRQLHAQSVIDASEPGDNALGQLADAIGSMPLLVAEKGFAPAVPAADGEVAASGDELAPLHGAGWYFTLSLGGLLVLGGLLWIILAAVKRRKTGS